MDPITATILAMAVAGVAVRFMGGGVGVAAAAIKGQPSPAAQKWEARQKAKQADSAGRTQTGGKRPEQHKPGLLRVLWDNAVEERTQKAAARHVGRMEALREMAGTEQAKAREKLLRQAQRRAAVAERIAGLGNQSWGYARRVAEDTAGVIHERRAEQAARRGQAAEADEVDVDEPDTESFDEPVDGDVVHEPAETDAEVIPLRRKKPSAAEQVMADIAEQRAETARVAAQAGTNAAPTEQMFSDWRRAQGRQAPTEAALRERFGDAGDDEIYSTQIRGSFRVIPHWRDVNGLWQMWHEGSISTQQLNSMVLSDSEVDPVLAAKLQMTAADLSPYAAKAGACLETEEVYTPPNEAELRAKFGHRATAEWTRYVDTAIEAGIEPVVAQRLGVTEAELASYAHAARESDGSYTPPTEAELAANEADVVRVRPELSRRCHDGAEENGPGDPVPESSENTVDGGNPDMTSATAETTTVPEIVDLATGISYTTTIGQHFSGLGAKLAEDAEVVGNNAGAFDEQVGVIEAGQAALSAQGFGGVIQSSFDEVAEKLPSAAGKLRQIEQLLSEVGEEITAAAGAMTSAKAALEEQRGLAEQVQAQSSSNGVANNTAFYQEA